MNGSTPTTEELWDCIGTMQSDDSRTYSRVLLLAVDGRVPAAIATIRERLKANLATLDALERAAEGRPPEIAESIERAALSADA